MFKTPILFLIFNRLDTAQKVFEKIKEQKPKYLYIAADGPRKNKKGEVEACKKTRDEILKQIDWDCELKTLFRDENLGCKMAVSGAITWFFDNVEQGIILEDDCLPDSSFFGFCETMLEKYKDDERIMHIGGTCYFPKEFENNESYYFSYHAHIRGWATRKRARKFYDVNMKMLNEFINNNSINRITSNRFTKKVSINHFLMTYNGKIDTRDYQRTFAIWNNNGIAIGPLVNLISNIGFGKDALHTKNDLGQGNLERKSIKYNNLKDPTGIIPKLRHMKWLEYNQQFVFKAYVAIILRKIGLYNIIAKLLGYK